MKMEIWLLAGLLAAFGIGFAVYRSWQRGRRDGSKVAARTIKPSGRLGAGAHRGLASTKCSYCKKKVKRVAFYAGRNGQVVGLCDLCKVQAERQALLRL